MGRELEIPNARLWYPFFAGYTVDVLEIFRRPGNEVNFINRKLAISNMIFLLFPDNNINKRIGNFYAIHLMIYISIELIRTFVIIYLLKLAY